jgi:hypothetical protein
VEKIHGHASGLNAAALIESAYRNLHNLFDKPSRESPWRAFRHRAN